MKTRHPTLDTRKATLVIRRERTAVNIGDTLIDDTFAEAFTMWYCRLIVTAHDEYWLDAAVREFCGYGSSVIACDCEAALEKQEDASCTPDGRSGASIIAFGFSADALTQAVANRTGQCLMTCATTAVFNGLESTDQTIPLGKHLRFFGDGYQKSKMISGRRFWRIPVMDGEFIVEDRLGIEKGVAGGNIIVQAVNTDLCLDAVRRSVAAVAEVPGVITPFPGGVARSGSKVGSRYKALKASTSDAFCPTLRGRTDSKLHPQANCALEIVINGCDAGAVRLGMAAAIRSAAGDGVVAISAGNYGGKLGKHHFSLCELLTNGDG